MINNWVIVQPLQMNWAIPDKNAKWTNHADASMSRLLRAPATHIRDPHIDKSADAYVIGSFDISLIEKEIAFAKEVRSRGAKVVVGFSSDLRFLVGSALISPSGTLYTGLCENVDVILSGFSEKVKAYGRFQDKVIGYGVPVEDLNFSKPYAERDIDLLVSSSRGEENFATTMEALLLIRARHPNIKIVYSIDPTHSNMYRHFSNVVQFVPGGLMQYMPKAKVYLSPELRPRPGRSQLEAWYCRVPFISSSMTYFSRWFPDYTFDSMSPVDMADKYEQLIQTDHAKLIADAEPLVAYDHWDNFYKRLLIKLGQEE